MGWVGIGWGWGEGSTGIVNSLQAGRLPLRWERVGVRVGPEGMKNRCFAGVLVRCFVVFFLDFCLIIFAEVPAESGGEGDAVAAAVVDHCLCEGCVFFVIEAFLDTGAVGDVGVYGHGGEADVVGGYVGFIEDIPDH